MSVFAIFPTNGIPPFALIVSPGFGIGLEQQQPLCQSRTFLQIRVTSSIALVYAPFGQMARNRAERHLQRIEAPLGYLCSHQHTTLYTSGLLPTISTGFWTTPKAPSKRPINDSREFQGIKAPPRQRKPATEAPRRGKGVSRNGSETKQDTQPRHHTDTVPG